jgi:CelD/BcsL family acetyltransferase involved in cellulose biosynthesis/peptidoglycan/xylan/chitin deacetylase (PgdA/CDA1 family)
MLRVARYQTWQELQELRSRWNSLLSCSSSDTVFLTWQWCEAWWKNYGSGREISVLAAWDKEELVGVAPLYVDPVRLYGKSWRRLRFIGDGSHDSDYLDCFVKLGCEAETMAAFAGHLGDERESWDWMELDGPRKASACVVALLACAREKNWALKVEPVTCSTLRLPNSWEDYLRMLEPRFRTKVRSSLALLNNSIKSDPVPCASNRDIDSWLALLFDLHTRRWADEGMPGVFRHSTKRSFYRDLSRAALDQGWLTFHRLDWGERPLALQYGLVYRNCFHLLQEAYDPSFSTMRPGFALRAWLMRHWIEKGLSEYDFLAGAAPHKLDWGATEVFSTRLLISASTAGKAMALTVPKLSTQWRESFVQATPTAVLALRRKIVLGADRKTWRPRDSHYHSVNSSGVRRIARRAAAAAYSSALFGRAGRMIATKYTWSPAGRGWKLPLRRRERPAVHIFQYHRINADRDPFLGGLAVEAFRAQMQYLASVFPIVSLDQVAQGVFPDQHQYCAAVTFDDGYRDNFVCAFPILKQLGIPATIFLATGYVDSGQLPWYDQVRLAFKLTTRAYFSVDRGGPGGSLKVVGSRLSLMERTLGWLRRIPEVERGPGLQEVFRELGVASDVNLPNQMLRWEDIRQMSKQNISFGAHTVTHPVLSQIPVSQLKPEIEGSKRTIEKRLQQPVAHFAYPFGQAADLNNEARHAVQAAGFTTAVTTMWGLNELGDDPLLLKRFTPWETNLAEFKMKLDWFRFCQPQKVSEPTSLQTAASFPAQEARV